jgi:hypothetical protein
VSGVHHASRRAANALGRGACGANAKCILIDLDPRLASSERSEPAIRGSGSLNPRGRRSLETRQQGAGDSSAVAIKIARIRRWLLFHPSRVP